MSRKDSTRQCYGCKSIFPIQKELSHYQFTGIGRYGIATPECLAAYTKILAKENEQFAYPPVHRLIVDAYAIQHPRDIQEQQKLNIEPRLVRASIQSIAVHLFALYCAIELQMDLKDITKIMNTLLVSAKEKNFKFDELEAPEDLGIIKVSKVYEALCIEDCSLEEYNQLAWEWAKSAWNAWKVHHATIRKWYKSLIVIRKSRK